MGKYLLVFAVLYSLAVTSVRGGNKNGVVNGCRPLSLKISDKVQHRPRRVTIAHRGASAHVPEHTLAGYRLALELGADYIEPDLLATADGVLVAMHSADLTVATDVTAKFPNRAPWFSPWVNRTGYWIFNFTAAEIATLTVKQTLPEARTTVYDGLWGIPTLTDIVNLMIQWNTVDLPQRLPPDESMLPDATAGAPSKPTPVQLKQSGIYAELKDSSWLQAEAGLKLVDLLLQHIRDMKEQWQQILPCFEEMQFDAYKVPGLVLQSFDANVLSQFHDAWKKQPQASLVSDNGDAAVGMPEPPYVLLVDKVECNDEEFWFKVGEFSRELVEAVGVDKSCLIGEEVFTLSSIKAEEYGLDVHAWTERPEYNSIADSRFKDELEEMEYLYCHVGVHGLFSESVSTAVTASLLPCDKSHLGQTHQDGHRSPTKEKDDDDDEQQFCYDSAGEASFFTGVAAFVMGAFMTSLFFIGYGRHYIRWQSTVVPSAEVDGVIVRNQGLDTLQWPPSTASSDVDGNGLEMT